MKGKLSADGKTIIYNVPMRFHQHGGRRMIMLPEHEAARKSSEGPSGDPMVNALVKARRWQKMLDGDIASSVRQLAELEKVDQSFMARILHLNNLAPDIVESILDGKTPDTLSLESMRRKIPLAWSEQRKLWGMATASNVMESGSVS
jgi:hypothetical protein